MQSVDEKWVKEENRIFSVYPGTPKGGSSILGEQETWLEVAQFFVDDLRWLLSLKHHKFWSHMIYSDKIQPLLVSFLKEFPPNHVKEQIFQNEEMKNTFMEIEHLVFLIFLRLSTEQDPRGCYIENLGEVLYNNYLFTVPIILDICFIYGPSNGELVKKMINNVIRLAPAFLEDFREVVPQFFQALRTVRDKVSMEYRPRREKRVELKANELRDLALYMYDTVATVQIFLEFYPRACHMFPKHDLISEIVAFYSNVLPEMHSNWEARRERDCFPVSEVIESARVDLLKLVKSMFDFVSSEANDTLNRKEELVDEYLNLMVEVLSEPLFLIDYNQLYSVEFEVRLVTKTCPNVDTMKVDHILDGVVLAVRETIKDEESPRQDEPDMKRIKLNSLITEVKDILPHLEDDFIGECLKCYDYNTERVIAAVLENSVPMPLEQETPAREEPREPAGPVEYKGKHRSKHKDLNELLDDREELREMKERYSQLAYIVDETYDDEYDDTYDEIIDVGVRDGEDTGRRPFVVPRVLRTGDDDEEEEQEDEKEEEEPEETPKRDIFVENPAERRERMEQRRADQMRRDVTGRGRGRGQSREVLRNREFKGTHKSSMANHNRKKQASRKMNRGMLPS